ncbi:hypothetical protein EIP86_006145 [Pleurotus ostreatoroseus]|nr:hypothetical protein EIP86_006145 [Pleurotus ostreatoroseus]
MAATAPSLEISGIKSKLPTCSPNLMPFHIAHTGPAPISTFFRPKKGPTPAFLGSSSSTTAISESQKPTRATTPTIDASGSQQTLAGSSSSLNADASTSTLVEDVEMSVPEVSGSISNEPDHLIAAFRGRTVRGMTVDLPEGYIGLVLDAPDDAKGKAVASVKMSDDTSMGKTRKGFAGKRGTRRVAQPVEEEEEANADDLGQMLKESNPVRSLNPISTFSSFVLWNADRPVDASRDEYLRAITEWTQLAAVIHSYDD